MKCATPPFAHRTVHPGNGLCSLPSVTPLKITFPYAQPPNSNTPPVPLPLLIPLLTTPLCSACLKITAKNNQLVCGCFGWREINQCSCSLGQFSVCRLCPQRAQGAGRKERGGARATPTPPNRRATELPPASRRSISSLSVREKINGDLYADNPLNSLKYYAQIHLTCSNTFEYIRKTSLNRMSTTNKSL